MQIGNRYQVVKKLGQGGMGAVYEAYDRLEKHHVALKRVETELNHLQFNSKGATGEETVALIQEFSILASLRHPHIISVLDYGLDDAQPFFTMEFVPQSQNFMQATQDLSDVEQVELLIQVLEALRYLHRRGVIHRDVKPDNILLVEDNRVKVLDFGLSVNAEIVKGRAGTLAYMSPETLQSQTTVPQSDLYAVGVMAYKMITGELPFAPQNILDILMMPADMQPLRDHPAMTVIERLLSKTPDDRYASADDCIRAFQQAMGLPAGTESVTVRESFLQASTFIGRDAELQTLNDALQFMLQGRTSFYLVGGESGAGKSRLLDELRIQALVSGTTVLRGQAVDGGGLPFQLWRNIVRRLLLMVDVTDVQARILKDIVSDIDDLIGRPLTKAPELSREAFQEHLILTIVDLIQMVQQPLLLLLEDLQWAGESLVPIKQLLLVQDQLSQVMVVATYRNDESPDLPQQLAGMDQIQLKHLPRTAIHDLSKLVLGGKETGDDVVDFLEKETEGNVFFIIETLRALAEDVGSLDNIGRSTLPQHVFTGKMRALMHQRLSKIDSGLQALQQLAAVFGREVDRKLLEHHYDVRTIERWLNTASDYAVLHIHEDQWRFAHDKLRETLLMTVPVSLYRKAAETIEAIYPDNPDYNEVLLRHWQQVDDSEKIYTYLLPVTHKMINLTGDYAQAERLIETMLQRLPEDDPRCIKLWNHLALLYYHLGNNADATRYAQQAQTLSETHHDFAGLAASMNASGRVKMSLHDYDSAEALFQQSMTIRQQLDDKYGISGCLHNLAHIAADRGDYARSNELYQQSLAIKQQVDDQPGISDILMNLGVNAINLKDFAIATDLLQQSLSIKRQLEDRVGISLILSSLGRIEREQGNDERALELYGESLAIRRQIGDRRRISIMLSNIGWIMLKQGKLRQAPAPLHEGLSITSDLKAEWLSIYYLVSFAGILTHREQAQKATELLGFVSSNPLKKANLQERIDELLPQLETILSPDILQTAFEQGKTLNLDTIVHELLTKFGQDYDD